MAASGFRRRHQNDARPGRRAARQGFERQQNLIHRAEPVRADDNRRRAQGRNQVARIEIFAERTQQAARAFDQHHVKTFLHRADMREHVGEPDALAFAAGGEQRRDGARKCHGLISSSVSAPSSAACSARASSRPPEQTGLSAAALTPRSRKNRASSAVSTVLPTPVSVPVMKNVFASFRQHQSGNAAGKPSKPLTKSGAVQLTCTAR